MAERYTFNVVIRPSFSVHGFTDHKSILDSYFFADRKGCFYFQIHAKYEHANKHKRNLLITGGVTASVLVSPILAGLAVGRLSFSSIAVSGGMKLKWL